MQNYAIKSNHIFIDHLSSPIAGYLLVNNNIIHQIIPLEKISSHSLSKYTILDYENFYVMPGLIDLNMHLHENFEEDWKDVENTTKMSLMGGVTTIIANPMMNSRNEEKNEVQCVTDREKELKDKISVDCGLLAYLGPHNCNDYETIFKESGVLGFKIYLSQPFDHTLPSFESINTLLNFIDFFQKSHEKLGKIVLSINCEMASNRDLFMASPCRKNPKEKRLDLEFDIHNTSGFGGGHHGVYDFGENEEVVGRPKAKSQTTTKNNNNTDILDIINDINTLEAENPLTDNSSPSTALLNLNSQLISNILEQKHVSDLELLEYESSGVTLNEGKKSVSENGNLGNSVFDFQDHDSNLEEDVNSSLIFIDTIDEKFEPEENDDKNLIIQKKIESCPFIKSKPFILGQTFEDAFEEIKKKECEDIKNSSDKSSDSVNSLRRNSSSFGERRKKKFLSSMNSKFKEMASIKTKKDIMEEKEKRKNRNYTYFLPNHPVSWETNGTNVILKNCKDAESKNLHIILTNLSSSCLAFRIREAKKFNPKLQIFCDTAAPFIFFNRDMVGVSQTKLKSSPPIRDRENQFLLVRSAKAQIFDSVSSYHFATPSKMKEIDGGNFRRAFNGISSVGGALNMLWTKFYSILRIRYKKKEGINTEEKRQDIDRLIQKVIYLMSSRPSELLFLQEKKGTLHPGKQADIMIWDPFKIKKITDSNNEILLKEPKNHCLLGYKVYGEVVMTMLGGNVVFKRENDGKLFFEEGKGQILRNSFFDK